jgi:hypothetical protein
MISRRLAQTFIHMHSRKTQQLVLNTACVRRNVVVDINHPSFTSARFRSRPLWQSGCDSLVLSLGPCVATNDQKKLYEYVDTLTAGQLVLIQPTPLEAGGSAETAAEKEKVAAEGLLLPTSAP